MTENQRLTGCPICGEIPAMVWVNRGKNRLCSVQCGAAGPVEGARHYVLVQRQTEAAAVEAWRGMMAAPWGQAELFEEG